ncbi:flavodoxin domain-containing protein [Xylanimonas ulmi]|uniref:Flavodoxin-like protein n=1 Tax=Xylanimonas ulmi TaxID=228973 RepID=A0A4Q7M0N1_9MICO|nr:flavodoxin domain-containing protein [Xylanibacterium ulmi]RZS60741.1 flavodoxin-like protein [Xylanibacterium ulmi]
MRAAIVVASMRGTTAEVACRVAEAIADDVPVFDLVDGPPVVSAFDTVVLGTAIYRGQPMASMRRYAASTTDLVGKRIALFVCGMSRDPVTREAELAAAYPGALLDVAVARGFLGGRVQTTSLNALERLAVSGVAQASQDVDAIDDHAIGAFGAIVRASAMWASDATAAALEVTRTLGPQGARLVSEQRSAFDPSALGCSSDVNAASHTAGSLG